MHERGCEPGAGVGFTLVVEKLRALTVREAGVAVEHCRNKYEYDG